MVVGSTRNDREITLWIYMIAYPRYDTVSSPWFGHTVVLQYCFCAFSTSFTNTYFILATRNNRCYTHNRLSFGYGLRYIFHILPFLPLNNMHSRHKIPALLLASIIHYTEYTMLEMTHGLLRFPFCIQPSQCPVLPSVSSSCITRPVHDVCLGSLLGVIFCLSRENNNIYPFQVAF